MRNYVDILESQLSKVNLTTMKNKNNNPINNVDLIHRKRTLSRLMAVQIFYQFEFLEQNDEAKISLEKVAENVIDHYALTPEDNIKSYRSKIDEELIQSLTSGVNASKIKLDDAIKPFLNNDSKTEKLENLLWQILRFGAFELQFITDTSLKIIINEYLDIASFFFPEKQVKFVNSILENLAKKYRAEEFSQIKKS